MLTESSYEARIAGVIRRHLADAVRDHCWTEGDQEHMDVVTADVMPMKGLVSPLRPWHRGAGGGWRRTRTPGSSYPSATGAVRRPGATSW